MILATCPKCGKTAEEDDQFCRFCGASLKTQTGTTEGTGQPTGEQRRVREPEEYCYGPRERRGDYPGLVSFGLFLLIVGAVFVVNPSIFSQLNSWGNKMSQLQMLQRPPQEIINSAMLFFVLVGLSDFFVSGLRYVVYKRKRRALGTAFSGVALIAFSYLIYLYGQHKLGWQLTLAYEIVVIGLLVIVYAVASHLL